jgi:hypothetical protein
MGKLTVRIFGALPDAVTSFIFLVAWITPTALGPQWVQDLMLTMLIEFVVMHSSVFYGAIVGGAPGARGTRSLLLVGLTAFYMLFIVGFSFAFKSTWPIFAFGWLFMSRFANIWIHPQLSTGATTAMASQWAASAVFYLVGVFVTLLLPLPSLGLTREFVASMHLSGSGAWIDHPHIVIAFGALYFGAQSWFKFYVASKASADDASAAVRDTGAI